MASVPETALHREIEEETGLAHLQVMIRSAESTVLEWVYQGKPEELHHIGMLYDVVLTLDQSAGSYQKRTRW